jgi:hypothetical protein
LEHRTFLEVADLVSTTRFHKYKTSEISCERLGRFVICQQVELLLLILIAVCHHINSNCHSQDRIIILTRFDLCAISVFDAGPFSAEYAMSKIDRKK